MPKAKGSRHYSDKLTSREVDAFTSSGRLNDGDGLSLSITAKGHTRWVYRYTFGGKAQELFLGSKSKLSLKQARVCRDKAKQHLELGINPADIMSRTVRRRGEVISAGFPNFR